MSLQDPAPRPDVDRVQILDDDGRVLPDADPPDLSEETLVGLYEMLWFARRFDERCVSLQRQGRIGTYAPMRGQEGAQVASAMALDDEDWLFPTYRDHAAKVVHGMSPARAIAAMAGYPDGYAVADDVNVMPEAIPIATQVPHAAGLAWAKRLQGDPGAALCYLGDGATSEGDFHEGLNFAGVFDVPAVFFCNNNQWAISVPRERQSASATIAQKARAYGFEGVQVDGMDPLAVYQVTREALEKTKNPGEGERRPTLVEAVQYRLGAHSTADDPSVYRDEVPDEWEAKDPVPRYESYLRRTGLLDDERVDAIHERVEERLAAAIDGSEAASADPDDLFEHVYDEVPPNLARQREALRRHVERHGHPEDHH